MTTPEGTPKTREQQSNWLGGIAATLAVSAVAGTGMYMTFEAGTHQLRTPAGVGRARPDFTYETDLAQMPMHSVLLAGDPAVQGKPPAFKNVAGIVGIPESEVTGLRASGCDDPIIGIRAQGSDIEDEGYLHTWNTFSEVMHDGQAYMAIAKTADGGPVQIAIGCTHSNQDNGNGPISWANAPALIGITNITDLAYAGVHSVV